MTNQLAHYNILNEEMLLPFSSVYNINNREMQMRSIEILEELRPEVIIVSPAWEHEAGNLSMRNYYLYQYLIKNYIPCKYKNIIFLTNQSEIQNQYKSAYEEFAEIMHIEYLRKLPVVWGNEYLEEKETKDIPVFYHLSDTNMEKLGEDHYRASIGENYLLYTFEENIDGSEIPFLRIGVHVHKNVGTEFEFEGVVYFMDEGKSLKESHHFIYDGGEGEFLIPLSTSPYWSYSKENRTILLDFIGDNLKDRELEIHLEFETMK